MMMVQQVPRFRERPEVATVMSDDAISSFTEDQSTYTTEDHSTYTTDEVDIQTRDAQSQGSRSSSSSSKRGDIGVELVLAPTTDSQRASDMILPTSTGPSSRGGTRDTSRSSPYEQTSNHSKTRFRYGSGSVGSFSTKNSGTGGSRAISSLRRKSSRDSVGSFNRRQQPDRSNHHHVTSKKVESKALFDDVSENSSFSSVLRIPIRKGDTIWRAAKRGDLAALKQFHSQGNVDWLAKDNGRIPLFYACHTGAIVDINVVHFLLWVTPIRRGSDDLEKCKNPRNKAVMKILDEFEKRVYKSPMQFESKVASIPLVPPKEKSLKGRKQDNVRDDRMPTLKERSRRERKQDISGSLSKTLRYQYVSTRERSNDEATFPRLAKNAKKEDRARTVVQDSMLQTLVEDVNKIQVTPSNVTNMTIDDSWSLGSMFSFAKLKRKESTSDRSADYNDAAPISRSRSSSIMSKDAALLRRKVSFDHKPARKFESSSHGFQQSPRDKVCHHAESRDDGTHPRIDYDERNLVWTIENHIAMEDAATSNFVLTIHVFDSSQKVVVRNCHGVSVDILGKAMYNLSIEDCSDVTVVFDSVAHSCRIVHCKNIAVEATGICQMIETERLKGLTVWLSRQSAELANIVTSKCTCEVRVMVPSGDGENEYERQELALPEKYVHQFAGGRVKSRVSSRA